MPTVIQALEKARLIKGKKTPENKVRLAVLKAKIVAIRAYLQMKSSKPITEIIQPLTEREAAPDKAMPILMG